MWQKRNEICRESKRQGAECTILRSEVCNTTRVYNVCRHNDLVFVISPSVNVEVKYTRWADKQRLLISEQIVLKRVSKATFLLGVYRPSFRTISR